MLEDYIEALIFLLALNAISERQILDLKKKNRALILKMSSKTDDTLDPFVICNDLIDLHWASTKAANAVSGRRL